MHLAAVGSGVCSRPCGQDVSVNQSLTGSPGVGREAFLQYLGAFQPLLGHRAHLGTPAGLFHSLLRSWQHSCGQLVRTVLGTWGTGNSEPPPCCGDLHTSPTPAPFSGGVLRVSAKSCPVSTCVLLTWGRAMHRNRSGVLWRGPEWRGNLRGPGSADRSCRRDACAG